VKTPFDSDPRLQMVGFSPSNYVGNFSQVLASTVPEPVVAYPLQKTLVEGGDGGGELAVLGQQRFYYA